MTLALSQYVLPEDLYPWLTLLSGVLVVVVGLAVLRSRARKAHVALSRTTGRPRAHDHDSTSSAGRGCSAWGRPPA